MDAIQIKNARTLIQDIEHNADVYASEINSICEIKQRLEHIFKFGKNRSKKFTLFAVHSDIQLFYLFRINELGFSYLGTTTDFIGYGYGL